MTDYERALLEELSGLGKTSAEVAGQIRVRGIKGVRGNSHRYPIAVLVRQMGYSDVSAYVRIYATPVDSDGDPDLEVAIDTPAPVMAFITDFDNLLYTDLEARR